MAWTYNNYEEQASDSARLSVLRQHITEVSQAIQADVSSDGHSRSAGTLQDYLSTLHERRKELERLTGSGNRGSGRTLANFRRC